jgi:hypothetical protein
VINDVNRRKSGVTEPELARLIEVWPGLPDATRREIIALVDGATGG